MIIHPEDARSRGLAEGVTARVFNDRGAFDAVVRISEDVRPGVAVAPLGYWASRSGGSTVNALNPTRYADFGHAPTFSDNLVEVAAS